MWLLVHRNKVVLLAAAAAGVFVGGRYLVRKLSEQQDGQQSAQLRSLRLKEHYDSNRQTCLSAVVGLVPSVRGVVSRHLDAETITSQLKTKPDNKVTLWENLKVVSFSRLVAGVYACSLLVVFLRVQLSVLGGCMFLDLQKSTGELSAPADVQKQYLSTVQYLLQEGLVSLMRVVREAAEGVLLTYSLKHQLTCEGMLQLLSDIRLQTASHPPHSLGRHRQHTSFLVQYLLPKESLLHIGEKVRDSQTDLLLAATRDIIESPDFSSVLDSTVDCAFVHLSRTLVETYHSAAQSSPALPLARIIPLITDHAQLVFSTQSPGSFAQMLLAVHELQTFSENIYEAFSHNS